LQEGGALAKMLPVFSIFAGGPLGSGQQWFSWVHRDDLVELILEVNRLCSECINLHHHSANPDRSSNKYFRFFYASISALSTETDLLFRITVSSHH
jgi:hypothetical protein